MTGLPVAAASRKTMPNPSKSPPSTRVGHEKQIAGGVAGRQLGVAHVADHRHRVADPMLGDQRAQPGGFVAAADDEITQRRQLLSQRRHCPDREIVSLSSLYNDPPTG